MTSRAEYVLDLFVSTLAAPALASLSETLACIVGDVCRSIAVRCAKQHSLGPLVIVLWSRLRRLEMRFSTLMAALRAGHLPPAVRPPAVRPPTVGPPTVGPPAAISPSRLAPRLPGGFAWLVRLMPEVAVYGSQLEHLLTDPELPALLAADPRLGRVLRPLCRMLAIRPALLMLPPRSLVAVPPKPEPPPPEPLPPEPSPRGQHGADTRHHAAQRVSSPPFLSPPVLPPPEFSQA